jgi:putative tryptophan/tyrosine transport system substrate-binding protein
MRRREFIAGLGSTAAWPVVARAQQPARMKRVAYVVGRIKDAYGDALFEAFREALAARGWVEGRNVEIIDRRGAADPERSRAYVTEMLKLTPDVIVSAHTGTTAAFLRETGTIPIVSPQMGDPVDLGWVKNIGRPEGNLTGFATGEFTLGAKFLEVLKEAAPSVSRILLLTSPSVSASVSVRPIEAAATSIGVTRTTKLVKDTAEIEQAISDFSRQPNGGLIVAPGPELANQAPTIVESAMRHRLPAVYPTRDYVVRGGLTGYAADILNQYRQTGAYVDRILKGAKVSDLPIQFPSKYLLIINLKTAKAMDLAIPDSFLLRADEVIE